MLWGTATGFLPLIIVSEGQFGADSCILLSCCRDLWVHLTLDYIPPGLIFGFIPSLTTTHL